MPLRHHQSPTLASTAHCTYTEPPGSGDGDEASTATVVSVPGRKKEFELGTTEAVLGQCAAALRAVGHAPPRRRSDAILLGSEEGFVQAGPGVVGTRGRKG